MIDPAAVNLGRKGGKETPSAALNTSGSYKPDSKSARTVGLPSPRNPTEKRKTTDESGAQVLLSYHSGKMEKADATDNAPLNVQTHIYHRGAIKSHDLRQRNSKSPLPSFGTGYIRAMQRGKPNPT